MDHSSSSSATDTPATAEDRAQALLALLPTDAQPRSLDRFEALLQTRCCPDEALRVAKTPAGDLHAGIVVPGPGAVGMLVLSPLAGGGAASTAAAVAHDAAAMAFTNGIRLVQMLIAPDNALHAACLRQAGFRKLATLHTMERSVPHRLLPAPRGLRHDAPLDALSLLPCLDLPDERVAAALESTYTGTLDCPGLLGLRSAGDTLEGHRASGTPLPNLWCLVQLDGCDIGVLLVTHQSDCCDLVYTGLTPSVRGCGIGMWLLQTMLSRLRDDGHRRIRLCVDSANEPALALYRSLGFMVRTTSVALIATPDDVQVAP